ncbi:hypothetical protein DL98DRAFT_428865, partial [Cadophora sp. DSE1049]
EYEALIKKGVFILIYKNNPKIKKHRIFKSKIINEVKNKKTATLYEKLKLVVQCFNNKSKRKILTQSLIIQKISQRLIIYLTAAVKRSKRV